MTAINVLAMINLVAAVAVLTLVRGCDEVPRMAQNKL